MGSHDWKSCEDSMAMKNIRKEIEILKKNEILCLKV
jgi:hypothetical protein